MPWKVFQRPSKPFKGLSKAFKGLHRASKGLERLPKACHRKAREEPGGQARRKARNAKGRPKREARKEFFKTSMPFPGSPVLSFVTFIWTFQCSQRALKTVSRSFRGDRGRARRKARRSKGPFK